MDLKSLVQNTRTLFSLPDVLICINQLIDDPNSQINDLAETILCDAGLAARLLRLANSAYYKPQRRVETVSHAIILLSRTLRARDNGAADRHPLLAWREAPHNQRINRTSPVQNYVLSGLAGYPPPR